MEQHPVPQHIASFEFKLFGNLTVRQFVTLAIPMSIAALFFFSNLPVPIRISFTLIFGGLGLFAALVPIGGRPLDKWVVAFIKAIMAPTQRVWIKEPQIPEFLKVVTSLPKSPQEQSEPITSNDRQRLLAYLHSLPKGTFSPFDVKEQIAIDHLNLGPQMTTAGAGRLPPPIIWPTTSYQEPVTRQPLFAQTSLPQVETIDELSMSQIPSVQSGEYQGAMSNALPQIENLPGTRATPKISSSAKAFALPGLEKKIQRLVSKRPQEKPLELISTPFIALASETNFSIENIIPIHTGNNEIKFLHGVGKTRARKLHFAPPEGFDLSKLPIRGERRFEVSEELKKGLLADLDAFSTQQQTIRPAAHKVPSHPIKIHAKTEIDKSKAKVTPHQNRYMPKPQARLEQPKNVSFKKEVSQLLDSKISIPRQQSQTVPLPAGALNRGQIIPLTNKPNVLSGLIATANGTPLESAILIVRDQNGIPVRALKTNKLGQFLSATPLTTGTYTIEVENQQTGTPQIFDPVTINLEGQIMAPLEIKAKQ